MKKKISFIIPIILIFLINACSGYKPIFSSQNLEFKIVNSNIEGEKNLSDKILNKLEKISTRSNKTSNLIKNISISIKVEKNKLATTRDSAGNIKEYRITLNTFVAVDTTKEDGSNNVALLKDNFEFSQSYKIKDNYSDTIKSENKTIDDLLNQTFQELIIKLSEKLIS